MDSADAAKAALEKGGYTEVITDGLKGDWVGVAMRAKELGFPVKLLSGDERHRGTAGEMDVPYLDKHAWDTKDLVGE